MIPQPTNLRNYFFGAGSAALAMLLLVSQGRAQDTQPPGNATQPNASSESSVLLPPPTPPGASQQQQAQTPAQSNMQQQPAQPQSNAQGSGQFMQPAGETQQQANQNQPLTPPQPPRMDDQSRNLDQSHRQAARPQLGVFVVPTDGAGVRIQSITSGTAAEAAGLKPGDILLAVNGQAVTGVQHVIDGVRAMNVGDAIELRIWRNGQEQNVTATLQEMQSPIVEYSAPVSDFSAYSYTTQPVVQGYYPRTVRRYYNYYPGGYYGNYAYPRYGYGYGNYGYYGYPYGAYYGTPSFGYYQSPWGQGVRIGSFGFGWR